MSLLQIPAAGPSATHCTLYHRDAGFTALAEAELYSRGGGYPAEPGVWVSSVPIRWTTCGYGIAGGRQLACAPTLAELEQELRALHIVAARFSVEARRVPRRMHGSTVAKTRIADCIDGDVSLDNPMLRLLVILTPAGYRLLVNDDVEPGETDWLGAARKPHSSMVGLPVRIAQAMLNLTVQPGDTVLDPFCGTGTIPLLAAWAGHQTYGSDISAACVAHAAENLAHFGQRATLARADARTVQQAADCIISNLPYGMYCHLGADAMQGILRNLGRLAARVTLVTSERLENDLRAAGYELVQVIPVESDRFERFVYVTRAPGHHP